MNHDHASTTRLAAYRITLAATTGLAIAACAKGVIDYGSKRLPHALEIATDNGCPTAVDTLWGRPCTGKSERGDTCVWPGDWVRWATGDTTAFTIEFDGGSPMREGCKLRGQRGKYACEVDEEAQPGDYKYSVKLDTCKEPLDPRIIVGTKK